MKKEEFISKLFESTSVMVDWDGAEHKVKDLMDLANKQKHSDVRLLTTDRPEQMFVETASAFLGDGCVVNGSVLPERKPAGCYASFTSGSTGNPKLIDHPIENFIAPATALIDAQNINQDSTWLNYFPSSTNALFGMVLFTTALTNARCVHKKFNPYHLIKEIDAHKPTHSAIIPGMYSAVKKLKQWDNCDLSSLQCCITGASNTVPGYFDDIKSKGGAPRYVYGTTEIPAAMTSYDRDESHLGNVWHPGAEWKEINGELWCRWDHMDWWQSGDLIEVDAEHGPKILGRKDNQFKFKDYKIVPEQYESLAKKCNNVTEAILKLEDNLILYYEGDATPGDIVDVLIQYTHKDIMPRKIIKVDMLPRSPLGKIQRKVPIL